MLVLYASEIRYEEEVLSKERRLLTFYASRLCSQSTISFQLNTFKGTFKILCI